MKKNQIIALIIITCAILCAISCASADNSGNFNSYPTTGVVIEVDNLEDTLTIQDLNGELWVVEGVEDLFEGDIVAMIMDDNGTETIYDDEIIDLQFCGRLGGWLI